MDGAAAMEEDIQGAGAAAPEMDIEEVTPSHSFSPRSWSWDVDMMK